MSADVIVRSSLAIKSMLPLPKLFEELASRSEVFKDEAIRKMDPWALSLPTISVFPIPDCRVILPPLVARILEAIWEVELEVSW